MSKLAPLALALALAEVASPAHAGGTQQLSLPGKDWSLLIDLAGFQIKKSVTRPDGSGAMLEASNRQSRVIVSIFLERRPDLDSSEACKADYWAKALRSPLGKSQVEHGVLHSLQTVSWTFGDTVTQKHVNAYVQHDDVCVDVHLSRFPASGGEEPLFAALLESVRFAPAGESDGAQSTPAAPAALAPSPEAKAEFERGMAAYLERDLRSAERHFRNAAAAVPHSYNAHAYLAHSLFYQERYKEAVPEYQRARQIGAPPMENKQSMVRMLNDQLGMALSLSGRHDDAREYYDAVIREDPRYPMYYYNLACVYGELGNLEGALKNLELTAAHRQDMIAGEEMPDPRTDSSFARFRSDARFLAALKRLGL